VNPYGNQYNHKIGDIVVLPHHGGIEGEVAGLGSAHDPNIPVYFIRVGRSELLWPLREHEVEKKL
jgi:hypothetical protein